MRTSLADGSDTRCMFLDIAVKSFQTSPEYMAKTNVDTEKPDENLDRFRGHPTLD